MSSIVNQSIKKFIYIYNRKLTLQKADNDQSKLVNELKSIDKRGRCKTSWKKIFSKQS